MKNMIKAVPLAALALAAACGDSPIAPRTAEEAIGRTFVLTQGAPAPAPTRPAPPARPWSALGISSNVGGAAFTPIGLVGKGCTPSVQSIFVMHTITGAQDADASFRVNTVWTYTGTGWVGSVPVTVNVPSRSAADAPTARFSFMTVINGTATASGPGSFTIVPFDVSTSGADPLDISLAGVTVHVEFEPCDIGTPINTPPTIGVPSGPLSFEATSGAGASIDPRTWVTASDFEDGNLTSSVECTPAAGTFPLGDTHVDCSVQDSDGEQAHGGFTVRVVDTTAPEIMGIPTEVVGRIAQNGAGWTFDLSSFGITVSDQPLATPVSAVVTLDCTAADGTVLALGSDTQVSCTATDQSGNESTASFDVLVTLDATGIAFQRPLRTESPYSAHKRGSTVPHKFGAPRYADGTAATDLAGCLKLVVTAMGGGSTEAFTSQPDDFSAGSTAWRWDPDAGHYVFNAKTDASWPTGVWTTTVSCRGVVLARTIFELRR